MSTTNVLTTAEDGHIDETLTVDKTGTIAEASMLSSSAGQEKRAFFFFDTSDGATGIPGSATIDAVDVKLYCSSLSNISGYWEVWAQAGGAGSTLDAGDWSVGGWTQIDGGGAITATGVITISLPVGLFNRAGYTNVKVTAQSLGDPEVAQFDTVENASGNEAYLAVTYTPAAVGGDVGGALRDLVHPMRRAQLRGRAHQRGGRALSRVAGGVVLSPGYDTFERSTFLGDPVECYRFVQGATEWRFTSADESITLSTGVYAPEVIVRDGADFSQEDTAGNIAVRVHRANPVALLFVSYIPTSPVFLTLYRKHRSDPETIVWWQGRIVSCVFDGPEAQFVCAPISQVFRRKVPAIVFESQCNWTLYGTGCGLNKASFKDSGTVTAVAGATVRAAIFGTRAAGYYTNGWAELANGERRFIVDHSGDQLTLMNPFPSLAVGASIDAFAGCDRTEAVCAAKFNNLVNHLGFARVPTRNPYGGAVA